MLRVLLTTAFVTLCLPAVYGITVPDDQCPQHWGAGSGELNDPACRITHVCTRTDGAATITATGTPAVVLSSEKLCDNCDPGCPEVQPPLMDCVGSLSVSFTESLSATVSSEITAGIPGLEGSLGSAIGAEQGRVIAASTECGAEAFPACKKGKYNASMNVLNNITAKIVHTYTWVATPGAGAPNTCVGHQHTGGTSTSTASGNKGTNAATCKWGGYLPCP